MTISGRLDMGAASNKTTDRDAGAFDGQVKRSTLAGAKNSMTTGRITFAGSEDLGGGLKAGFNIESTIDGGSIGNRNLFLSLSSDSMGTVQIGRYLNAFSAIRDSHYSVAGAPGGAFLPQHIGLSNGTNALGRFGIAPTDLTAAQAATGLYFREGGTGAWTEATETAAGVLGKGVAGGDALTAAEQATISTKSQANAAIRAANAGQAAQLNALMSTGIGSRSNDALSYTSPNFGGFTATVGLVSNKIESRDDTRDVDAQAKASGQMYSIAYASGPLSGRLTVGSGKVKAQAAAVGANDFRGATAAQDESRAKVSDQALLVSYDFGVAQAYVMTERTKGTLQQFRGETIDGAIQKTRASEIGVKMPLGAFEPFVTMGRGKIQAFADGDATNDLKTSAWQLGSKYNLSKRTYVYGAYGSLSIKSRDADLSEESSKTKGYAVGLVHFF